MATEGAPLAARQQQGAIAVAFHRAGGGNNSAPAIRTDHKVQAVHVFRQKGEIGTGEGAE